VVPTPAHHQNDNIYTAQLLCHEDLLVVSLSGAKEKVSLWDGKYEVWLEDLDISSRFPGNHRKAACVTLGKNLLALSFEGEPARTLIWRVDTSQPVNTSPKFTGTVLHARNFILDV
jgi:hypothetical protein